MKLKLKNRRNLQRIKQSIIYKNPLATYQQSQIPYRNFKTFSTIKLPDENFNKQNEGNLSTSNNPFEVNEYNSNFNKDFNNMHKQFLREFDDFHRHYFDQLPLRRYAYNDEFSKLDNIFNEEFNRIRSQFFGQFDKINEDNQLNQKQETKSKDSKQEKNIDKKEDKEGKEDNLFEINPFFSASGSFSNVHKLFEEEQERLQTMMRDFESEVESRIKKGDPNVRQVRQFYRRTPEKETHEYFDSQRPERNFKVEREFAKASLSENKTEQTKKDEKQSEDTSMKMKDSKQELKSDQLFKINNPIEKPEDVSTEDHKKILKLSYILKKEYNECLEQVKLHKDKSVGQIIDIITQGEQYDNKLE